MSRAWLLGLDVGGGGGRALLVDAGSGEAFVATRSWQHTAAPGTGGTGTDVDLEALLAKLGAASREVLTRAGARPTDVVGVGAAVHQPRREARHGHDVAPKERFFRPSVPVEDPFHELRVGHLGGKASR